VAAVAAERARGADFRAVVERMRAAAAAGHGLVWGLGAHVIKTGLAPVLIDLMERGYISALAMNGAGLIHDFEMALGGPRPKTWTRCSGRAGSAWRTRPGCS
jgi:deoxyhypusine synthase